MLSLVELFVDALSVRKFHNVKLHSEQPRIINGRNAVRFELSYDSNSNVNYTAQAVFIKHSNSLYTIYGSAPTGYLFENIEPYFVQILESVRLL